MCRIVHTNPSLRYAAGTHNIILSSETVSFRMPFHVDDVWAEACGGAYFMTAKVGYPAYVLEFVYHKYLNGVRIVTRRVH